MLDIIALYTVVYALRRNRRQVLNGYRVTLRGFYNNALQRVSVSYRKCYLQSPLSFSLSFLSPAHIPGAVCWVSSCLDDPCRPPRWWSFGRGIAEWRCQWGTRPFYSFSWHHCFSEGTVSRYERVFEHTRLPRHWSSHKYTRVEGLFLWTVLGTTPYKIFFATYSS